MFIEHFKESFPRLIAMRNKEQLEALEKKLKETKKAILKKKKKLEIDDSSNDVPGEKMEKKEIKPVSRESVNQRPESQEISQNEHSYRENISDRNQSSALSKSKNTPVPLRSKGGDPHGAIALMEQRELEKFRQEKDKLEEEKVTVNYKF
jgi:hypothetical protein